LKDLQRLQIDQGGADDRAEDPVNLPQNSDFAADLQASETALPNDFENFVQPRTEKIIYDFEDVSSSSPFLTLDELEIPEDLRPDEIHGESEKTAEKQIYKIPINKPYSDRKCSSSGEILVDSESEAKSLKTKKLASSLQHFRPWVNSDEAGPSCSYFDRHKDELPAKKVTVVKVTPTTARFVPILPKLSDCPSLSDRFSSEKEKKEKRAKILLEKAENAKKKELEKNERAKKKEIEKAEKAKKRELEKEEKAKKKELERAEKAKRKKIKIAEIAEKKRRRNWEKTRTPKVSLIFKINCKLNFSFENFYERKKGKSRTRSTRKEQRRDFL
jgi:hypothetical protein